MFYLMFQISKGENFSRAESVVHLPYVCLQNSPDSGQIHVISMELVEAAPNVHK